MVLAIVGTGTLDKESAGVLPLREREADRPQPPRAPAVEPRSAATVEPDEAVTPPGPAVGSVRIRVVAADGTPVPSASVVVSDGLDAERETATDSNGIVRVDDVAAGVVAARGAAPHFVRSGWSSTRLDGGGNAELTVTLQAGNDVTGRVVDARTGAPIAGATVVVIEGGVTRGGEGHLSNRPPLGVLTSGEGGWFEVTVPTVGVTTIVADAPRRARNTVTVEFPRSARDVVQVALEAGWVVVTHVVGADGVPQKGVAVRAMPEERASSLLSGGTIAIVGDRLVLPFTSETDARGVAEIRGLDPETDYVVVATSDGGGRSDVQRVRGQAGESVEAMLRIRATTDVHVRLEGMESVSDSLATLTLTSRWGERIQLQPSESGSLSASGVPVDVWTLHVRVRGHAAQDSEVVLNEGKDWDSVVQIVDGESLSGHVVDDMGRPVAGASVFMSSDPQSDGGTAVTAASRTGSDGSFKFTGLPRSRCRLRARAPGHVDSAMVTVEFGAGPATIHLLRSASLRVGLNTAVALPQSIVAVVESMHEIGDATYATFRMPLSGAEVELDGIRPGQGTVRLYTPEFVPIALPFDAAPGTSVDLGTAVLRVGENVAGRLVDAEGHSIAHAEIVVRESDAPHAFRRTTTDAHGRFQLRSMPSGSTDVSVVLDGEDSERDVGSIDFLRGGNDVTIQLPPALGGPDVK